MPYKPLITGFLTKCQTCYTIVAEDDQDAHDQAMHSDHITATDINQNVVMRVRDDGTKWRTEIVEVDKDNCYHHEEP